MGVALVVGAGCAGQEEEEEEGREEEEEGREEEGRRAGPWTGPGPFSTMASAATEEPSRGAVPRGILPVAPTGPGGGGRPTGDTGIPGVPLPPHSVPPTSRSPQ